MLVTSSLSFSHSVFYPMVDKFNALSTIKISIIWTRLKFCYLVKGEATVQMHQEANDVDPTSKYTIFVG